MHCLSAQKLSVQKRPQLKHKKQKLLVVELNSLKLQEIIYLFVTSFAFLLFSDCYLPA